MFSCKETKKVDVSTLIDQSYYSVQSPKYLYCSVYYHFKNDSLFVYNSTTDQNLRFEIKYKNDFIELTNDSIKNYKLKTFHNTEGDIIINDIKNYLSFDQKIKLNKILIDDNLESNIFNTFWQKEIKKDSYTKDSLWFYFNENGLVDIYRKNERNKKIDLSISDYKIIELSEKVKIIDIRNISNAFLMTKNQGDNMTLSTSDCDSSIESYQDFKKTVNKENDFYINKWIKTNSENEFDLPNIISLSKDSIDIDTNRYKYTIGLNEEYILYNSGYYYKVDKLNKDTLILSIENSVKETEKGIYIPANARR